jgi:beta-glucosidase
MGGPAIADLLFGVHSPSGKLPATFPRHVGQIPIYYNQKNTGKPPSQQSIVHIDDIDAEAPQTSLGMTAFHLDTGYKPLYPFGFGLSYTDFRYSNLRCSAKEIHDGDVLEVYADLTNDGDMAAEEIAQLYVRDLVGSVTRPMRELKDFKRVAVQPGETVTLKFELPASALAFYGRDQELQVEPGEFHVWVGGSSEAELQSSFRLVSDS